MAHATHIAHRLPTPCHAVGADFELAAPEKTYLRSCRPVVATCAVRTGCGKSQVSRYIIDELQKRGKKCVLVRHPMVSGGAGWGGAGLELVLSWSAGRTQVLPILPALLPDSGVGPRGSGPDPAGLPASLDGAHWAVHMCHAAAVRQPGGAGCAAV